MTCEPSDIVASVYDRLARAPSSARASMTAAERALWCVVSARCQLDMGGVEAVFTDAEVDVLQLVESLKQLGEDELASAWEEANFKLTRAGYLASGRWTGAEGSPHRPVFLILEQALGDRMWALDPKLAAMLESPRE